MKRVLYPMFLLIFCFSAIGVCAETKTPPEPLPVEEINTAVLEMAGWIVTESMLAKKEWGGVQYDDLAMVPNKPEPRFIFNHRRIVAKSVRLIQPRADNLPSTYEYFVYLHYSKQPAAVIIEGEEPYGEKRIYIALRRKDSWEFYSMRPEIKWRLEFDKDAEPEFAADIKFD